MTAVGKNPREKREAISFFSMILSCWEEYLVGKRTGSLGKKIISKDFSEMGVGKNTKL